MCGIAGIINLKSPEVDRKTLGLMGRAISSRGPDDEGFFTVPHAGLAHRRLSIIDLKTGHQPITSSCGRYTIVYNGETYNYQELRDNLIREGVCFKTNSDTETVLELFARKGPGCLKEMNGMFAFVIWDNKTKTLFAARDRMGKKPFYYTKTGDHFVFASELKSLLKHPAVSKQINKNAIPHFLTYEYVPAPLSMIEGVHKLPQGHFLSFSEKGLQTRRYWNQSFADKIEDSEENICKNLVEHLEKAVAYRLIADVPVGVFLSGGIDSSAIVALLARQKNPKDIKTFSINFKEASYDESRYSSMIAKQFGTDHYEDTLTAPLMLDILPQVVEYMDEPFADGSILPTCLLSRFTRKHVKVAIGGDGGDELFAGYPTFLASRVANIYNRLPSLVKKSAAGLVNLLPTSDKNMSLDFKARQFLSGAHLNGVMRNQIWLAGIAPENQPEIFAPSFYESISATDTLDLIRQELTYCDSPLTNDQELYFYQKFYMCDDILVKVDRASMAHSLEVRAPFLDPHVVEYVNRLPYKFKLKGKTSKYILKKALKNILPGCVTQRPKKGFGIPVAGWLKEDLKPLMVSTLSKKRIKKDGYFNFAAIDRLMQEHVSGKRNNRKQLFSLLMLHWWMDNYL